MIVAVLVIVLMAISAAVLTLTLKGYIRPRDTEPWLERTVTRRLIVHLKSGQTVEGSLAEVARDGVIVRAARLLSTGEPVPMAGEVFIPREQVAFTQLSD